LKILRFFHQGQIRLGVLSGESVHDLAALARLRNLEWAAAVLGDLRCFLLAGEQALDLAARLVELPPVEPYPVSQVRILAPFESGSKILAHVVNYWEHGAEADLNPPEFPFFFYKQSSSVVHPGDPIIAHSASRKMDHEVELAAIVGKVARNVPEETAEDVVAGYTVLNDVSYRDFQMVEGSPGMAKRYGKNWTQGKGLDHACPMGPWVVMRDELPSPYPLMIECKVNGEIRQHSTTGKMIHKLARQIAEISRGMTLYPGDVISTGTCEGGGVGSGKWLQPGDVVECTVEKIGTLTNPVVAPAYRAG
jgi:2-keto-4-pentenoate hydratase/2-oxohepta-3-ene-1,7-dioic acid hydratase in catechol pathway